MRVQKLLPRALPLTQQVLRRGKPQQKRPTARHRPILKGLQRRRIIFMQRRLEPQHQGRTLLNQPNLVAAQNPQLLRRRIVGPQYPPSMPIGAQGVGKAPGVQLIILDPAGGLAIPKPLRRLGIHRIDRYAHLQEPLDRRPPAGLDGHADPGKRRQRRQLGPQQRPALGTVRKLQFQPPHALAIDHHHVMLLAGPVEPRKVRELRKGHYITRCVHKKPAFPGPALPRRRPRPVTRRPDTRPSWECGSLRRQHRPRPTAR